MAYGHTDDVPKTVDLEAKPTPESSSLPPNFIALQTAYIIPFRLRYRNFKTFVLYSLNQNSILLTEKNSS
ncbi:MAG: hypothetical protein COA78_15225 [Blastopirellula sp.]|nr:MAG: hypothetical protein COA78_15225 [Blastopirellula sp.]